MLRITFLQNWFFLPSYVIASKQFFNRSLKKDFLQKLEVVPSKFKKFLNQQLSLLLKKNFPSTNVPSKIIFPLNGLHWPQRNEIIVKHQLTARYCIGFIPVARRKNRKKQKSFSSNQGANCFLRLFLKHIDFVVVFVKQKMCFSVELVRCKWTLQ